MTLLKADLEPYVCSSNTTIFFKLVRKLEDIEDDSQDFNPEMTHQFFGDKESIFGYTDLHIKLYYTAGSLKTYLGLDYGQKIDPKTSHGVEVPYFSSLPCLMSCSSLPDDVMSIIKDKLEINLLSNLDEFSRLIEKEKLFKPYGDLLKSFSITDENGDTHTYEIRKTDYSTPGFLEYHERMQSFILWFIDAASYIDSDDERWDFYTLYEKYEDCGTKYAFVGYSTVYKYYAYPDNYRPRISQMLVLPPFQKQGLGATLLQAIYHHYAADSKVLDITVYRIQVCVAAVEDPSESFTRIRDVVDTRNCQTLPVFHPSVLRKGFTSAMWKEAQNKFKINKKQARKVYEILRLKNIASTKSPDYRAYRLDVKQRLNAPFKVNYLFLGPLVGGVNEKPSAT
ncbi:HAT1, partial [Cordylochernes scorpioides]